MVTTTPTTTPVTTTRMTMIEEGTHLRLKTESVAVNSDIFAERDGPTPGPTDTVAYRDAMDASKKQSHR